ncbi:MAG: pyridoxal-dependent decarboxylase [Candidatus Promineofilum sp.]|uniref:pyridoxal-dependent decarboxylase n=1 Tax=Promineifilum sp. TaxID=2664178 RepID=UPI00241206A2|nr:pyridoxal-dependent decarboxylase [Promineifilum sp.]
MTPDEFRAHGKALIDWIADYYEQIEQYPVLSAAAPGSIRAALPDAPPAHGEPFESMMADVEQIILPGITHWQSPNFFAYFPANASFPSILGELLSAGLGVQGMIWQTSPAATELETLVLDWLVAMLGLPPQFLSTGSGGGVIQDTASSAVLAAMLAARDRMTNDELRMTNDEDALTPSHRPLPPAPASVAGNDPRLRAYCSTQTHSSVAKAAGVAGVGRANLRAVAVDDNYAMRPDELRRHIEADRAAGLLPFFVCATIGTTSSNALDPLRAIGAICREFGLWLHVDAAMAGTAALCPEFRHLQDGLELADSYAFNPHKWMFTNFDCDCFWVADRAALIRTLSILPDYLKNAATASGAVIDYRDWHVQLGRRFRALKLWFVIRHYGVEGLRALVREHVRLAQAFAGWVAADPRFELAAPAPLNLVCFRLRDGGDEANRALLERLNTSGKLYLTHTVLDGRYTLRLCVGQTHTEERHVRAAWAMLRQP